MTQMRSRRREEYGNCTWRQVKFAMQMILSAFFLFDVAFFSRQNKLLARFASGKTKLYSRIVDGQTAPLPGPPVPSPVKHAEMVRIVEAKKRYREGVYADPHRKKIR